MKQNVPNRAKVFGVLSLSAVLSLSLIGVYVHVGASDHDDGEAQLKSRALNLTDLYVFKESSQSGSTSDTALIFIMGTNPRSVARTQYYFNTNAYYDFNIARRDTVTAAAKGTADITLRFRFGSVLPSGKQPIQITSIVDGVSTTVGSLTTATFTTTPLVSESTPTINTVALTSGTATESNTIYVFAGLREDPFFFDVEQYHRVRNGLINLANPGFQNNAPVVTFRTADTSAVDFAKGYNINAIVVRVPRALLQSASAETVFDVWQTISI